MKKRGKRAISLKIIFFLFIVLALFLLVIATDFFCSGEASFFRFRAVFLLFLLLLLSLFFFLCVYRPYRFYEERLERVLRGYAALTELCAELPALTPMNKRELELVSEILNSAELSEQSKRQAQYQALQNQINPHFLYNTLDGIRSEALIAGLDKVAEMTEALAAFFRYTISNTEDLVTLEEELENCNTYFKIQKYRFGDRLLMRILMDEEDKAFLLKCMIPKLSLQPILENSIIHGTELKLEQGCTEIRIERTDRGLLLTVSDNGVGMDQEHLRKLRKRLGDAREELSAGITGTSKGGIALSNVNKRIHILFGEEYGLHIFSVEDIGTDVEITLPLIRREAEKNSEKRRLYSGRSGNLEM
ncbi:MAG: sensor histidine kinase [Oribacterium sp.]